MRIGAVSMGDTTYMDPNALTSATPLTDAELSQLPISSPFDYPDIATSAIGVPCMPTGSQGPLQPGQVWCDTGTGVPPPNAFAATSGISTGVILAVVGIGIALAIFKK